MLEILYNRRSTRKFLNQKIEEEKIKKLLIAAQLAPSSKGRRPWEFILVNDAALLENLSTSKPHGALLLKHAPLAIIIAGIVSSRKPKAPLDPNVKKAAITTFLNLK